MLSPVYSVGSWRNGVRDGTGVYVYVNGDVYTGPWKDNMRHNYHPDGTPMQEKGRLSSKTFRTVYTGDWYKDRRHGRGKGSFPNGDEYEGEYKDGKRTGRGTMKYKVSEMSNEYNKYEGM
jgi:hypothetical protein